MFADGLAAEEWLQFADGLAAGEWLQSVDGLVALEGVTSVDGVAADAGVPCADEMVAVGAVVSADELEEEEVLPRPKLMSDRSMVLDAAESARCRVESDAVKRRYELAAATHCDGSLHETFVTDEHSCYAM